MAAYASYEGFLLIVSPDFTQRLSWTSFSAGGASDGRAVAASGSTAVYAAAQGADQAAKGTLITASALASKPLGGADGYVVVLPAPLARPAPPRAEALRRGCARRSSRSARHPTSR